jgi:hypothetical protein
MTQGNCVTKNRAFNATTDRVNDVSRSLQRSPLTCLNFLTTITLDINMPTSGITLRMNVAMSVNETREVGLTMHSERFIICVSFKL